MKKPLIKFNLEKSDLYYFGLILIYAVFACTGKQFLANNLNDSYPIFPGYPSYILVLIGVLVVLGTLYCISIGKWPKANFGFSVDKNFWIFAAISLIIVLIVTKNSHQQITADSTLMLLPISFYILGSQIIMIGLLFHRIEKIFGETDLASGIALIISGLLYLYVVHPIPILSSWMLVIGLLFIYKPFRSLFLLFFVGVVSFYDVTLLLPTWIVTLVLYCGVAYICVFLKKRNLPIAATE